MGTALESLRIEVCYEHSSKEFYANVNVYILRNTVLLESEKDRHS